MEPNNRVEFPPENQAVITIRAYEKKLAGDFGSNFDLEAPDSPEDVNCVVLDTNRPMAESEVREIKQWIDAKVGGPIDELPVTDRYTHPDGSMRMDLVGPVIAEGFRFARQHIDGLETIYILAPQEFYVAQEEEADYTHEVL